MGRKGLALAIVALATLAAACGDAAVIPTTAIPPAQTETGATSLPAAEEPPATSRPDREDVRSTAPAKLPETVPPNTPPAGLADVPSGVVGQVLADAGPDAALLASESVTWPDGSLGCPQPGESYTQAPVSGYRLLVDSGGRTLDYRALDSGYFVLCDSPVIGGSGGDPTS